MKPTSIASPSRRESERHSLVGLQFCLQGLGSASEFALEAVPGYLYHASHKRSGLVLVNTPRAGRKLPR